MRDAEVSCANCGEPVRADVTSVTGWSHDADGIVWCNPEYTIDNAHTTAEPAVVDDDAGADAPGGAAGAGS